MPADKGIEIGQAPVAMGNRLAVEDHIAGELAHGHSDGHELSRPVPAVARPQAHAVSLLMGDDPKATPLRTRKERLAGALQSPPAAIRYVEHLDGEHGPAAFQTACRMDLEGIVSKRADSRYKSGPCRSWVKVKNPGYERR